MDVVALGRPQGRRSMCNRYLARSRFRVRAGQMPLLGGKSSLESHASGEGHRFTSSAPVSDFILFPFVFLVQELS